jgi:hypothetical protein
MVMVRVGMVVKRWGDADWIWKWGRDWKERMARAVLVVLVMVLENVLVNIMDMAGRGGELRAGTGRDGIRVRGDDDPPAESALTPSRE